MSQIQGIDALQARLKRSGQTLTSDASAALLDAGAAVVATAKFMVPKETGHLAASIVCSQVKPTRKGNLMVEITAGDETTLVEGRVKFQLAKIIEFGTVNRPPQPFLRPAIKLNSRKNRNAIRKAMRNAIKVANGTNTTAGT